MEPFIGVTLPHFAFQDLKRNALLFDRIAILELPGLVRQCRERKEYQGQEGPIVSKTLEWLEKQGLIFGITHEELGAMPTHENPTAEAYRAQINDAMARYIGEREQAGRPVMSDEVAQGDFIADVIARGVALVLRDRKNLDAVSAIAPHPLANSLALSSAAEGNVVDAVLDGLPIPDDMTPWEAIIEFRSDTASRAALLGLRRWMRQMATGSTESRNVEQELEWLVNEYEEHMRLHRLKVNKGTLEIVVTFAAALVEDIVKLRLRDAVGLLFEGRRRTIALAEAERAAPGRELAYLSRARSSFIKQPRSDYGMP